MNHERINQYLEVWEATPDIIKLEVCKALVLENQELERLCALRQHHIEQLLRANIPSFLNTGD